MTGLIGWWPLHENSGSTAHDLSGNDNHGSSNGVNPGVAGKGGLTGYSFDGAGDYVDLNRFGTTFTSLSISAWVNVSDKSSTGQILRDYSDNSFTLRTNSGEIEFGMNSDSSAFTSVTHAISNDTWYHVVATWDGSQIELYINGEKKDTASWSDAHAWDTNRNPSIGYKPYNSSQYYNGKASSIRLYDRALTPSEIQELYEWGSGDYVRPPAESDSGVSRWSFDGDVTDSWGSRDGTDNTSAGFSSDSVRGQSKSFDGSDDFVDIGSLGVSRGDPVTVNLWIKKKGDITTSEDQTIFASEKSNPSNGRLYIEADNDRYQFYVNSGIIRSTSSFNYSWNMHTFVCDGSTTSYYINNVFQESIADDFSIPDLVLGQDSDTRFFEGKVDDLRIYSRNITRQEISELYRYGTRGRDMRKFTVNSRGL
ncbi:LamG-like jellyroll fold domain-containing protein [Candidatus Nanosalina sp. VS9-1]|uniref:LamG domain-containing protein n=1 Tax=Candidatus Nanosalina sp. VS9-1 TaxID=3388566 RepID=UPI0039E0DE77